MPQIFPMCRCRRTRRTAARSAPASPLQLALPTPDLTPHFVAFDPPRLRPVIVAAHRPLPRAVLPPSRGPPDPRLTNRACARSPAACRGRAVGYQISRGSDLPCHHICRQRRRAPARGIFDPSSHLLSHAGRCAAVCERALAQSVQQLPGLVVEAPKAKAKAAQKAPPAKSKATAAGPARRRPGGGCSGGRWRVHAAA